MAKQGYILRYFSIIKKLKAKPYSSFEELAEYLKNQLAYLQPGEEDAQLGFSKRTFQRDIREIRNLFGIHIEYDRSAAGYIIQESAFDQTNFQRLMDAFDIYNMVNGSVEYQAYVFVEQRPLSGLENFHGLLHAIRNRLEIRFTYEKFWEGERSSRQVRPHALKEFRSRWYLLATDCRDEKLKSFALDRLTDLEISRRKFSDPGDLNIARTYQHCFGIMAPAAGEPEELVLSFDPFQGKYIKTLPLHPSQEILLDNEEELKVRLRIFITHDFIMELMSLGDAVQVLQPSSLAQEIRAAHEAAFRQYDDVS